MTQEQLREIAHQVQEQILVSVDSEIQAAKDKLGITADISDSEWDELINLILA